MGKVRSFRFSDSPEDQAFGDRLLNALRPLEVTLVLAGDYGQYESWIRGQRLSPAKYVYVSGPVKLSGMRGVKMIRVGTWRQRKDLAEIMEIAETSGIEVVDE